MRKSFSFSTLWCLLSIVVVCAILFWPLLRPGFIVTDDGNWMIIRLSAFYQSLREGQFPVRFLGRLNYGYGYPVANFLYPGFLYLGSLIHILGFSFVNTVKLLLVGSVITSSVFVYLWLRKSFHLLPSLIGTVGYTFAPYLAFDIYTRGSVGEVLSLCWVAMGLYGIDSKKPNLLTLAVALVIMSHNSLALLFLAFIMAYLLITKNFRQYIWSILLGVGMVAFFWFPALYEKRYVVFDTLRVARASTYFLNLQTVPLVGFSGLLSAFLLLAIKPKSIIDKFFILMFSLGVFFALPISFPLWRLGFLGTYFQFPFRFLSLGLIATPWIMASLVQKRRKLVWYMSCIFVIIWGVQLMYLYSQIRYNREPEGFYTTNEATTTVRDEYMPRWVVEKPTKRATQRVEVYKGDAAIDVKRASTQHIDMVVRSRSASVIQLNTIYYPGWGITVDGVLVPPDYQNKQGVIRISVPEGTHTIVAGFRETVPRFLADLFSIAVGIIYVVSIFLRKSVVPMNAKKMRERGN